MPHIRRDTDKTVQRGNLVSQMVVEDLVQNVDRFWIAARATSAL